MSISAMKQALKFCEDIGDLTGPYPYVNETQIVSESRKVLTALRQAIAEAEKTVYVDSSRFPKDFPEYKPGMTVTKPKQQEDWYGQHQWQCGYERGWDAAMEQKREWVGLTKDEVDSWELPEKPTVFEFAQFVEAKLKEKNT
jgi:hypothetical protein